MIEIDDKDWAKVETLFSKKEYAKGKEVFTAGEVCQKLYYVSDGALRVYSITTEGKELTMDDKLPKRCLST